VPGSTGIPKAESSDSIGVNVFGRALKLGENGEVVTSVGGIWVIDFEQSSLIALNN
jgi:hypothetical protein